MTTYPIPEPYCWDESFAVFYEQLDEEHKGLFKGIFEVAKDPKSATAVGDLKKKVKDHFAYEEGKMANLDAAYLTDHKKKHSDFVSKLEALSPPVDGKNIDFAKDWLVQHIKNTDFQYKGKL
uniref:Hemerythrin n=1 Tax=Oxydromus pugettensis TaxID=1622187 RepID=A0A1S6QCR9_9ANNE|nr:hemerythrin [Oxydromus pugettensis]